MSDEKNEAREGYERRRTAKERVKDITTINFSITKCPHRVYEEFVKFCKRETNENYSMGLKLLVDGTKNNIKETVLFEQYMELKQSVDDLRQEIEMNKESEKEVKKETKTFS